MQLSINPSLDLLQIREALEASWDEQTSYLAVKQLGNPALGQCYPTSWVIQHFFPATEIIKGHIWTGKDLEVHFWNGLQIDNTLYHLDLTWHQFPAGSSVRDFEILDRHTLNDSVSTTHRCELLLERVVRYMETRDKPRSLRR